MTDPAESKRIARIKQKIIDNTKIVDNPEMGSPCLEWTGSHSGEGRGGGYPRMCLDGQTVAVHRVTYTLAHGYIPSKKQIDHLCRNRLCVAPAHLEMVTHLQNQKRRVKAAK